MQPVGHQLLPAPERAAQVGAPVGGNGQPEGFSNLLRGAPGSAEGLDMSEGLPDLEYVRRGGPGRLILVRSKVALALSPGNHFCSDLPRMVLYGHQIIPEPFPCSSWEVLKDEQDSESEGSWGTGSFVPGCRVMAGAQVSSLAGCKEGQVVPSVLPELPPPCCPHHLRTVKPSAGEQQTPSSW